MLHPLDTHHAANVLREEPRWLFLPTKRDAVVLAALGLASLGAALFFRYFVIENTPLGLSCEAGGGGFVCAVRLAVILLFTFYVFGFVALIAAAIQLWRPSALAFGTGLSFTLLGLVLYNNRAAALAAVLLVLSLARPAPEGR